MSRPLLKTKWFSSVKGFFLSLLILGLVPALAAESACGGRRINTGARREMMAEKETVREDRCQRTRDMVGLGQNLDPGPDLDRKTVNVVGLAQNHGPDPDPGKGGQTTHDCNNHLSSPERRGSRNQKTIGDAGLDPAQEREGKKKDHHPGDHRKLQPPVFPPLRTQNNYMPRKKRRIPLKAPSKKKTFLE